MIEENKHKFFYLHKWCIPVRGIKRSTINDFQRNDIKLIPNELCDILISYNSKRIEDVISSFVKNEDDYTLLDKYFTFLLEEEFVFLSYTEQNEFEIYTNLKFHYPQQINNCIIDYNRNSNYCIKKIIKDLNSVGCQSLQLRFFDEISLNFIHSVLAYTNNTTLRNVELLIKFKDIAFKDKVKALIYSKYTRVLQVIFHSCPKTNEIESEIVDNVQFIYSKNRIESCFSCGYINPILFEASEVSYLLGQNYNTCLYKKISVDASGEIRNCPSMEESFGNISNISILDVLKIEDLKKYWKVTKSMIDDCNKCEFRLVCTDCRAYLKNGFKDKPRNCNYDLYSATWL